MATGTLLYFAHVARDVLIPFAIAVFLWAIALSFDRLLSRATAFRRLPGPARTAFLALVALSIFLFVALVLATSVQNLVTAIPRIEERLQLLTVPFLDELGVDTSDLSINLLLRPEMRLSLFLSMMAYTRTFFTLAAQVVIFLVFFSIEGRYFARRIALAGDRAHGRERVGDWAERIRDLISRYLAVKVLSSLIVGAFAYFVLKLFRSEFALVVAAITKRANKESARRRGTSAKRDLVANAQRALAMKQAADKEAPEKPASRTADEGMQPIPNTGIAPSGALEQEGHRPVLERSRKVR